jgi:hypothetical protein
VHDKVLLGFKLQLKHNISLRCNCSRPEVGGRPACRGGEHSVGEFKVELVRDELFADPVDLFGVIGSAERSKAYWLAIGTSFTLITSPGSTGVSSLAVISLVLPSTIRTKLNVIAGSSPSR